MLGMMSPVATNGQVIHTPVMARSHCTGPGSGVGTGMGLGIMGYYILRRTVHTAPGPWMDWTHCLLLCQSYSLYLSRSRFRAVWMYHKTRNWFATPLLTYLQAYHKLLWFPTDVIFGAPPLSAVHDGSHCFVKF